MDKTHKNYKKFYPNEFINNSSNLKKSTRMKYEIKNNHAEGKPEIQSYKKYYQNFNINKTNYLPKVSLMTNNRYSHTYKSPLEGNFSNNNNINSNTKVNMNNKSLILPLGKSLNQNVYNKKFFTKSIEKKESSNRKNEIISGKEYQKININKYVGKYIKDNLEKNNINEIIKNNHQNIDITSNKDFNENEANIISPYYKKLENNNKLINKIRSAKNKSIRPISSNQDYKDYLKLPNGNRVFHFNKDLRIRKEKEETDNLIYPESYLCFDCKENATVQLNPDSLSINLKCKNGHKNQNIPINLFVIKNKLYQNNILACNSCKKKFDKKFLFYCSCNLILCNNCNKNKPHNNHTQIFYQQKNYFCENHQKSFTSFCEECNKNICNDCIQEHIDHKDNIIYFKNFMPKEKEIKKYKDEIEKIKLSKDNFNKDVDRFLLIFNEKRKEFNKKLDNYILIQNDLIDKINNKEESNYENICNVTNMNFKKNLCDDYLKMENRFQKKGKFLLNLFSPEENEMLKYEIKNQINNLELRARKKENYEIKKEINDFIIKANKRLFKLNQIKNEINNLVIKANKKLFKKNEIRKETNFNIIHEKKAKNFNIICKNINNIFINNSKPKEKIINSEQIQNLTPILNELQNIDNNGDNNINQDNKIKEENITPKGNGNTKSKMKVEKPKEENKDTQKKFEVIQKIEACEKKCDYKDERCITSFTLLKNNRIVITLKGGIIKFYEFEKQNDEIKLKELLRLEEEEIYCHNYAIELQDGNIAVCSEDGTLEIFQLFLDNKSDKTEEKIKKIQMIYEMNKDPIYIVKELQNKNLVLGCWKNILVFEKGKEYIFINKIKFDEYTFSILEISPNEIVATHSESKTLTVHNFKNYKFYAINNVESNENNNIICTYKNKRDIIFVAFDQGINIVSIVKKILIKKIILNEIISSLCPIEMNVNYGDENNIWGLMLGAKRKIFGEKVNFAYSMLQIGFNLNEKEQGFINDDNKEIDYKIISRKDRIHYYDITNMYNSLWNKNKDTMNFLDDKNEQWIFTSGNEDKLFKIWKFK